MHRVYHNIVVTHALNEYIFALQSVALNLLLREILAKGSLILSALLKGVEHYRLVARQSLNKPFIGHKTDLTEGMQKFCIVPISHRASHFSDNLLAHSVEQDVGTALNQDRWLQGVLPIVVVGESAQRSLNTANQNGGVRKEFFENLRIGRNRIVGAEARSTASGVGIV